MALRYEVTKFKTPPREFTSRTEARRYAEALRDATEGYEDRAIRIITWNVYPNLPHCKPDEVYKSCAMEVLTNDPQFPWQNINIFGY